MDFTRERKKMKDTDVNIEWTEVVNMEKWSRIREETVIRERGRSGINEYRQLDLKEKGK